MLGLGILTMLASRAHASCNVIPSAALTFRSSLGSLDRPFARPSDWVTLTLNPACDGASPGFSGSAADQVVTVVFTPPGGGPRNVVALATNCSTVNTSNCAARADVATATCIQVNAVGAPVSLERIDQRTLRFRFPDSDAQFPPAADNLTFTGPATLAVTAANQPLPCQLASAACAGQTGLLGCIDALFENNGSCNSTPDSAFSHFTALPQPNNYQGLCTSPVPPCTGLIDDLRGTIDADGNALIPMDWRGILVNRDAVPIARLLRGATSVEAFEGRGIPVRISDADTLGSYSVEGVRLPPLFDPQHDPTQTNTLAFFGSADAPVTILRVARHHASSQQCVGGLNADLPCTNALDCPGSVCGAPHCIGGSNHGNLCSGNNDCPNGECGPGLFDFSTRLAGGAGPIVLRLGGCIGGISPLASCTDDSDCLGGQCGNFSFAALDPVPLDGLNQTLQLNAFVMEEAINNPPVDLNGDGDATDSVIKLGDRNTGAMQAIGVSGSEGRAITRVRQPPFSFPALAVEGDVVAFLEPEPLQANIDANANGNIFDTVLKVYKLGSGELTNPLQPRDADAAPLIDHRSLVVSGGHVFFRSAEATTAEQRTSLVSVTSNGTPASGASGSGAPSLSADGRYVAFESNSPNLQTTPDQSALWTIFVHDRVTGTTTQLSTSFTGGITPGQSVAPFISLDGRHVAFSSTACNLIPGDCFFAGNGETVGDTNAVQDVFVRDRDTDGNGVFDDPGNSVTVRVSVASDGTQGNASSGADRGSISADGRFVAFPSNATNLVANDTNAACGSSGTDNCRDIFVHDRDADGNGIFDESGGIKTVRVNVSSQGQQANAASFVPFLSGDGRFVVFDSDATNLVSGDTNNARDVFLRDRDSDGNGIFDEPGGVSTTRVSVDSQGGEANSESYDPKISADGSTVVFTSAASNLVAGDVNGQIDVFVHERVSGITAAVSVNSQGEMTSSNSGSGSLSADGRFVAFSSSGNLVAAPPPNSPFPLYVHDRLTGMTVLATQSSTGQAANGSGAVLGWISADGRSVAYGNTATNLVPNDTNGIPDVFVRGADLAAADMTGDGFPDDTVLQVFDASASSPSTRSLCPANVVAVANGNAAFLRPEAAGQTPNLSDCPAGALLPSGKPDLNGDGDDDDDIVHLWTGGSVQNLGRAATAVGLSNNWVAALVSEAGQGDAHLNSDTDSSDSVVQVYPVSGGSWINLQQAADALVVNGDIVAFTTPEQAQGAGDLNGDGDPDDRVAQVYDAGQAALINLAQAAEEVVVGDSGLVAFRTREASQGGQDLNVDGDPNDDVLQVYDPATHTLVDSGMAVTPCRLEACDPSVPYRVLNDTVKFLTLEADQGVDLNNDGDLDDLVLEVLNVRQAIGNGTLAGATNSLAAVSAGICTGTARACAADDACSGGSCFVPPGGCLKNLGTTCDPAAPPNSLNNPCVSPQQFCRPILGVPNQGVCFDIEGPCQSDADCSLPATCNDLEQSFHRLMNPLAKQGGGNDVFTGSGHCVEDLDRTCTQDSNCKAGEFCSDATCHREQGVCVKDTDCPTASICRQDLIRSTAADVDLDEVPDALDNCPRIANVEQEDRDADGIGDACDVASCGNGFLEAGEVCDDGNLASGDGCDANCTTTTCGNGIAAGSEQCDDGNVDDHDACKTDCTLNVCGDGILQTGVEACDDGGVVDGDGCDSNCTVTACGNGVVSGSEGCDDGNLTDGDGCDSTCVLTAPQDSVVLPLAPINITIPAGTSSATRSVTIAVRNADILPVAASPGHRIRLSASTDCSGVALSIPDFDRTTAGAQDTVLVAGGKAKSAKLSLSIPQSLLSLNHRAPTRCAITFTASNADGPIVDPVPSNNSYVVDVNVVDKNDGDRATATETVIKSMKAVKISLPSGTFSTTKAASVKVVNADIVPLAAIPGHMISVTALDGSCPAGTVGIADFDHGPSAVQTSVIVKGGATATATLPLMIDASRFASGNSKSPHRCVALLSASGPGTDADASNNSTRLVIDVVDKNDL